MFSNPYVIVGKLLCIQESDNSKVMEILQDVIDGDLCEQYPTLTSELQRKIADELDRTPGEILKKLEDIRNRII